MEKLIDSVAVADRLNISLSTLRYLVADGRGPRSLRVGRRRMFRPEDVEEYIEAQLAAEVGDRG